MSSPRADAMKARLAEQFKGLPNLGAFLDAIGAQADDVDEFFGQLRDLRTLQTAVGVQLDLLGVILGEGRGTLSDDDYRTLLQLRTSQLQSSGSLEQLLQMVLILANPDTVTIDEVFPANLYALISGGTPFTSLADAKSALLQFKNAGVGLTMATTLVPIFAFDAVVPNEDGFDVGNLSEPV